MQNIFNTIKTSGHSSVEKYTSHFIWKGSKGLRRVLLCERWVGDWTELQHIDPHSSGYHSLSFPGAWAGQPWARGPSLYWNMVLIPASSLQLIWTYIIIWRQTTSCERHNFTLNSTPRQSRSPLISWYLRPDAPVIYTGTFLLLAVWLGRRSICNKKRCNNSHTSSTHIDLYDIPHKCYTRIIYTHCLRMQTGYYWYIYIYIIWKSNLTDKIKWNAVSSRLRSCRYCCMDALLGRWLNGWRRSSTAIIQECCEQYRTGPGSNTPHGANCTATYHRSQKLYKLDEPDMPDTAGEAKTRS